MPWILVTFPCSQDTGILVLIAIWHPIFSAPGSPQFFLNHGHDGYLSMQLEKTIIWAEEQKCSFNISGEKCVYWTRISFLYSILMTFSLIKYFTFKGCSWRPIPAHPWRAGWYTEGIAELVSSRAFDWYAELCYLIKIVLHVWNSDLDLSILSTPPPHVRQVYLCSDFLTWRSVCSGSETFFVDSPAFTPLTEIILGLKWFFFELSPWKW